MAQQNQSGVTSFTTADRRIIATRVFEAPRRKVWEAHVNPEHLRAWLLGPEGWTMPVCDSDPRPGRAWRFVWRKADGTQMEMRGSYREVVPPERIVHTESWAGDWPETVNSTVLTEKDGQTTVTVTVQYPSNEARDAALGTGMKDGWAKSYERLEGYLATTA